MRFYTIAQNGICTPVVSFDGGISGYSFSALGEGCTDLAQFLREGGFSRLGTLSTAAKGADPSQRIDLKNTKLCAPIMFPDQDIVCLGINYREHALEAGNFSQEAFGGDRPYTIYFSKRCNRATAPGEAISSYPGLVDGLDYEAELGVVIGKDVKNSSAEEAEQYVFGYTIINDVSARNLQTRHKQWYIGKSLDGFTPMGPCIVTADELGDPKQLAISSLVNGELRQNSNTSLMIQTVAGAIAEISQGITLKAGSIISMGTPSGVGMGFDPPKFLKHGDTVSCIIEGIGELTNPID